MFKIKENQNPETKQKNGWRIKNNCQTRNQQKNVSMFLLNKLKKPINITATQRHDIYNMNKI